MHAHMCARARSCARAVARKARACISAAASAPGGVRAAAIARFWETSVRISAGSEHMMKERTIDTCITLKERLFDIPEVDAIVQRSENEKADSSAWNSLWKLHFKLRV